MKTINISDENYKLFKKGNKQFYSFDEFLDYLFECEQEVIALTQKIGEKKALRLIREWQNEV